MEINYALIGKRIRETRKQRGLSAEELAEIADLSTVYISYIENAKRKPSLESLIKISNLFQSKNSMIVISTIKDVAIDERK